MNSYQDHELDLSNVLIANRLSSALDRQTPPAFGGAESNRLSYQTNDFPVLRSDRSSNEAGNRVQSANPPYCSAFPFGQNSTQQRYSSFKPSDAVNLFNFGSTQSTASNPFNFASTISPLLGPSSAAYQCSQFLAHSSHTFPIPPLEQSSALQRSYAPQTVGQSSVRQSSIGQSSVGQLSAGHSSSLQQSASCVFQDYAPQSSSSMATSTATSTRSTGKKTSKFQELPLLFTDVEILYPFQNYITARANFMLSLKKSHCDGIKTGHKSIFVRFCKFDPTRTLQKENLPKNIRLMINSCQVPLELKNTSTYLKSPIDVTARCRNVTTRCANTFEFNLDTSDECRKLLRGNGYGVEIVLARKLPVSDILQELRTSEVHTRSFEQTLKLIKERCAGFDEIQCEALKVPLTCVVTKKIIQLPLVGLKCRHVNCFDGATFLEMHANKQEFVCVICHNLIRRNELVRDPWIERILLDTQRTVEQIEFDSVGHYKISQPEKCAPKQRPKRIECITLDDEEEAKSRAEGPISLKITVPRPKLELIDALKLSATNTGDRTSQTATMPSSLAALNSLSNGSAFAPPAFSSTTNSFADSLPRWAARASANGAAQAASTATSRPLSRENAIDLTDTDSVIVLDSDSDVSHYAFESDQNSENIRDALDDSNEDTEISEEENTIGNDSDGDSNEDDSLRRDLEDESEDESEDEDYFVGRSRRRTRYEAFGSSSDGGSDMSEIVSQESLSDLTSNSNLSSLSSSSSSSRGSKDRQASQSANSSFTPLLSRTSLNKRRRSRRFD